MSGRRSAVALLRLLELSFRDASLLLPHIAVGAFATYLLILFRSDGTADHPFLVAGVLAILTVIAQWLATGMLLLLLIVLGVVTGRIQISM